MKPHSSNPNKRCRRALATCHACAALTLAAAIFPAALASIARAQDRPTVQVIKGDNWIATTVHRLSTTTHQASNENTPNALTGTMLVNGDFSNDLNGWTPAILGGGKSPGEIFIDALGRAALRENASSLLTLGQTFAMPPAARELSFDVFIDPGFDLTDSFFPDAFEVQLLDANNQSVVPTWDPLATSFWNIQEDLTQNVAPGVTVTPLVAPILGEGQAPAFHVVLNIRAVPAGTVVTLYIDLIGADNDTGSGVAVDNFALRLNQPPQVSPGGPYSVECQGAQTSLPVSAAATTDADGDPLTYAWSSPCEGATFDNPSSPTPTLTVPRGETCPFSCVVRVTVDDGFGQPVTAETTVTVTDTTPPTVTGTSVLNLECGEQIGEPALGTVNATDGCDPMPALTFIDTPTSPLVISRVWTARDACGNTATFTQQLKLTDTRPPVLTCPPAAVVPCGKSLDTADLPAANATDACDPNPTITKSDAPAAGEPGVNLRTWMAQDATGNKSSCVQRITFEDLVPPRLVCAAPPQVIVADNEVDADGFVVAAAAEKIDPLRVAQALDNCDVEVSQANGKITVEIADHPGKYKVGPNTAHFIARDNAGNTATCDSVIDVVKGATGPQVPGSTFLDQRITTVSSTGICGAFGAVPFAAGIFMLVSARPRHRRTSRRP